MPDALRLVTWNLFGLESHLLDERTEAACLLMLLRDPPDVVLLQEVVRRSLVAHLRPHFRAAGYTEVSDEAASSYFCAIFVRGDWPVAACGSTPFPGSGMGRALLFAEIDWAGQRLLVMTSHLESMRAASDERRRQLGRVAHRLRVHPGPAVFGGDTNLRDAEVAGVPHADQIDDAWESLGRPADRRFTWDSRWGQSPGRPWRGRHARARYDRVFLNRWPGWRAAGLRLIGDAPIVQVGSWDARPSDHAGLEVALRLDDPGDNPAEETS